MPIKVLNLVLIFFYLSNIVIFKTFKKFEFIISDLTSRDSFILLIQKFSIERTVRFTEKLYNKKIFNCLTCSIFLRKFLPDKEVKIFIGIKSEDDSLIKSHSWIKYKNKYIFGNNNVAKDYRVIIEK